jgi:Pyruvate/2-oxoacid:ferredoxin oxidoreductase delta subunit
VDPVKQAYKTFSNLISWSNFQTKLAILPEKKKWRFIRSSLMYQQAMKCKKCNPNIAMSLLCSCAESLKLLGTRAGARRNFETLYLMHCPQPLRIAPMKYYPNKAVPAKIEECIFCMKCVPVCSEQAINVKKD